MKVKSLSCVGLLATQWTAAFQAPPSMGFSRQEYWSGVPLPLLEILCYQVIFKKPLKGRGFPGGSDSEESAHNAGDAGSIPGSGRFPGAGNGDPLQCSCLGNSMDRGTWQAIVHWVKKELDMTTTIY